MKVDITAYNYWNRLISRFLENNPGLAWLM